ncbi:Rho GTPase activator (Lrg11), putative [Talaromyces stipitatus ATCC 10500]|uniref:Rho GTPase activator (Lrg11), putative n=1 Tax=Talaromyces stipitatus (strain ATCC 10500 / CBS 375.48 / QM 6759 / NRRL 1006) TaxID=441959 RepID=B8MQ92_TALSN|nr:Rho GTPase activator (Lrg11), putative [Talaromyces stipitatus ATCC 10500]EED13239.1 Rho GTPase activator (Lrg11), putative [Talaromyces stipitatus ATCC 10500]
MPDRTLPDILMPGNGGSGSPRPWGNGQGSNSQNNSPISPIEGHSPFERAPPGGTPLSIAAPAPTYQPDNRVGRNPPESEERHESDEQRDISTPRERSRPSRRTCKKCGEPLTGQFVRALNGTFHLECFKCHDCGKVVASKFFPVDAEDGSGQYPLCETDYFRRLNLLCHECGGALRGSYITALDRKYHIEHFTCSVCPTVFGAQDSYYEHEGNVYCHYHYSTRFAQKCNGCHTAILKQFVEIFRNGQNQHWHPECYMIHKFWNVRLAPAGQLLDNETPDSEATDLDREMIRKREEQMEEKVYKIWSILSTFEESSAACISEMLLHVSNGAYMDGVLVAKSFISHVEILFAAIDMLAVLLKEQGLKDLSYAREAKLLCKKIVAFFSLLSKTQETGVRKLGVTQELLSLVTGLAHYLKLLIRIGLQGALKLERERDTVQGLFGFLNHLEGSLQSLKVSEEAPTDLMSGVSTLADQYSDCCTACKEPIDDACIILDDKRWHIKPPHLVCSNCQKDLTGDLLEAMWSDKDHRSFCSNCALHLGRAPDARGGFKNVTKLVQYVFLLQVALARLLSVLRSSGTLPHSTDDPNLNEYDANEGHRVEGGAGLTAEGGPRAANTRSKSFTVASSKSEESSSLEQTVGEMRRLRSIRNERTLSTTYKKARASRIIDGPEGRSVRPGSSGGDGTDPRNPGFQIIEEKDSNGEPVNELHFGHQDALTLDDIPRIVAAEQAKEQRPNASRYAGSNLVNSEDYQARYIPGHRREVSGGPDQVPNDSSGMKPKKYFSELTALEYFIVRHVAVLSMEPLLEGHFNLEELLSLIESRKPTVWNLFGRAFNKEGKKVGKKKGVFGVSLNILVEKEGAESTHGVGPGALRIPVLIDDAVSAMRQMDMSVEGVFRKNGNIRRLKELAELIDNKYEQVDLSRESPVQVAALVKKFLREMPDPLLTFKLHRLFVISQKIADPEKRKRILHLTCCLLPKAHRDTMEVLFAFLNWAASFSHVDEESGSKMDIHNLATVMTPNILYPNTKTASMDESFLAIEAVTTLIAYNDVMCEVPEDLQSILNDTSFFKDSADITTKEILKRYGDFGKGVVAQRVTPNIESGSGSTRGTNTPVTARIETDPSQAAAWQMQSSVRHVQASGGPAYTAMPTNHQGGENGAPEQYRARSPSTDSQRQAMGQPSEADAEPLPYRPHPGTGPMGVAG